MLKRSSTHGKSGRHYTWSKNQTIEAPEGEFAHLGEGYFEIVGAEKTTANPVKANATDAAIALAEERGIDLADVTGTGAGGKITKGDIEALVTK